MKRIECIIMDWAGTAVDYGCFAPVAAFVESFCFSVCICCSVCLCSISL